MFEQYVPDLDAYADAWVDLARLSAEKTNLEDELKTLIANVYLECTTNPVYYVNGKPPSATLIDSSYALVGNTPEVAEKISQLKVRLSEIEGEVTSLRGILKVEEMKLSLYQTMSANSRNILGLNNEQV